MAMRTLATRLAALVCMALVATAFAACGGDDGNGGGETAGGGAETNASTQQITVGVLPIAPVAPLYVGMEKGFFEEEGLEVEPAIAQGGAALLPAVMSGEYEFGFSNVVSAMSAQVQGLPVRLVAQASQSNVEDERDFGAVIASADGDIREPEDLAGATIAVNTVRNIGDLAIRAALAQRGVDTSDIEFREIPFPDMNAALEAGRVDAAWQEEPFLTQAIDNGARVVLNHYRGVADGLTIAAYVASAELLERDPELVERFVRAMNRSLDYSAENPEEVRQTVTEFTEIPPEVAQEMVLPQWSSDLNRASLERLAQLGTEQGIFDEQPNLDELIATPAA
jgi:NitT/TauT family transport system substrate-binding protein